MYSLDYPKTPMLTLNQLGNYNLIIIDTSSVVTQFLALQTYFAVTFNLREDELEAALDWCVTEGVQRAIGHNPQRRVIGHYRHDVYRCIYEEHFLTLGQYFHDVLMNRRILIHSFQPVKCMVMGLNTILAIGEPKNA